MNNDAVANQALRRQLSEKLRAQNANYVFGLKDTPPSEAQFFAILDSADWASFSGLLRSHGAMVAKSLGLTGGAEELLVGIAWNIASCDLGRDCTQAGLSYVIQCAGNGRCPESVQQDMRVGLTAEQVERVEVFRKTIVNAAAARDGGFFGY